MLAGEARLASIGVATPNCSVEQSDVLAILVRRFGDRLRPRSRALLRQMFEHPSIQRRSFAVGEPSSLESIADESSDERIERFTEWALLLAAEAVREALERAGLGTADVRGLVVNTCTGYICPGLSTYLVERLGLAPEIRYHDLVGSGCAGAIPNLQIAAELLPSLQEGVVVSVAVEVCSATFQMEDDLSLIVSNALFADGAAAAVLWRRPQGVELVASASQLAPQHRESIRYVHRNGELTNRLSVDLPRLVKEPVDVVVHRLLGPRGLTPADVKHWAIHPGGHNIIGSIQEQLELSEEQLLVTRRILRDHGNVSSATVLFAMQDIMTSGNAAAGDWGILLAFGAGLAAHAYVVRF